MWLLLLLSSVVELLQLFPLPVRNTHTHIHCAFVSSFVTVAILLNERASAIAKHSSPMYFPCIFLKYISFFCRGFCADCGYSRRNTIYALLVVKYSAYFDLHSCFFAYKTITAHQRRNERQQCAVDQIRSKTKPNQPNKTNFTHTK